MVSIIMPTYNRKKVIWKAIQSCLNQTYSNIEILVIDDHSTDNTESLIKEYICMDARIKYFKTPDGKKGANAARNVGINNAEGEYITFCDSDDYLLPDSIKDRVETFKENPNAGMVYGDAYCELHGRRTVWKYDEINEKNRRKYLLEELSLCQQNTIMVRADILKNITLDENQKGWTDDFVVLGVGLKYPIQHCGKIVTVVVKSKVSMTSNKKNMYLGLRLLLRKYELLILRDIGIKRWLIWKIRLFAHWAYYKEIESKNYMLKEIYGLLHIKLRETVMPYFRHYFE